MLEDHSSRWSAAASPGGLIGLVLIILSAVVVVASALGIDGRFDPVIDDVFLYIALGVSGLAMLLFLYLLLAYLTIRYRLHSDHLKIGWGPRSIKVPFDEIIAIAPSTEVLGEESGGWQPYWPGYYVGTRKSELGPIRVVSTLPPQNQVLIARSDGTIYAVSPDQPQLFMEELSRWQEAFQSRQPETIAEPSESVEAVADDTSAEASTGASPPAELQPAQSNAHHSQVEEDNAASMSQGVMTAQEESSPAFGYSPARETEDTRAGSHESFETEPRRRSIHGLEPELPELQDIDTARYRLPGHPVDPGLVFGVSAEHAALPDIENANHSEPAVDAREDDAQPAPDAHSETREAPARTSVAVQETVDSQGAVDPQSLEIVDQTDLPDSAQLQSAPSRTAATERPVLQPLTRVHRRPAPATSSAVQPALFRDPVAITFMAVGLLATAMMAIHILVQYQDIPPSLTLHWNVDGLPGRVGEPQEIWVLPTIAGLVLIANIGFAWSIAKFDRFAARMMLGSTLIVHLVTWIALIMILR